MVGEWASGLGRRWKAGEASSGARGGRGGAQGTRPRRRTVNVEVRTGGLLLRRPDRSHTVHAQGAWSRTSARVVSPPVFVARCRAASWRGCCARHALLVCHAQWRPPMCVRVVYRLVLADRGVALLSTVECRERGVRRVDRWWWLVLSDCVSSPCVSSQGKFQSWRVATR